jgi:hypothetical protein
MFLKILLTGSIDKSNSKELKGVKQCDERTVK